MLRLALECKKLSKVASSSIISARAFSAVGNHQMLQVVHNSKMCLRLTGRKRAGNCLMDEMHVVNRFVKPCLRSTVLENPCWRTWVGSESYNIIPSKIALALSKVSRGQASTAYAMLLGNITTQYRELSQVPDSRYRLKKVVINRLFLPSRHL